MSSSDTCCMLDIFERWAEKENGQEKQYSKYNISVSRFDVIVGE